MPDTRTLNIQSAGTERESLHTQSEKYHKDYIYVHQIAELESEYPLFFQWPPDTHKKTHTHNRILKIQAQICTKLLHKSPLINLAVNSISFQHHPHHRHRHHHQHRQHPRWPQPVPEVMLARSATLSIHTCLSPGRLPLPTQHTQKCNMPLNSLEDKITNNVPCWCLPPLPPPLSVLRHDKTNTRTWK